jgi:hypothetical protein
VPDLDLCFALQNLLAADERAEALMLFTAGHAASQVRP